MNMLMKPVMILGLAGTMAMAAATPSLARGHGGAIAAGAVAGFAAGAILGSAANANAAYYDQGYAPAYGYEPGYYAPGYGAYGYAPYGDSFRDRQLKGSDW